MHQAFLSLSRKGNGMRQKIILISDTTQKILEVRFILTAASIKIQFFPLFIKLIKIHFYIDSILYNKKP